MSPARKLPPPSTFALKAMPPTYPLPTVQRALGQIQNEKFKTNNKKNVQYYEMLAWYGFKKCAPEAHPTGLIDQNKYPN